MDVTIPTDIGLFIIPSQENMKRQGLHLNNCQVLKINSLLKQFKP